MDLRSGHLYWPIRDGLLATYPPLLADVACDVVIIGAGITGALIAYYFSGEAIDTVVVDEGDVAAGSTATSTALLQHATDTEILQLRDKVGENAAVQSYRLGLVAIDKIAALVRDLNDDCGFERKASLYVASAKSHVARLRKEFGFREKHGFDVAFFSQAQIESRFEFLAPAAILSQGAGQINAYRLCHRLLQRAAAQTAPIFDSTKIAEILSKWTATVVTRLTDKAAF